MSDRSNGEKSHVSKRAAALAERLEKGARELLSLASNLSAAEWATHLPKDGRKVGVVVHHVASVYPVEVQLAQTIVAGKPITGVTFDDVHNMNADHALKFDSVSKDSTLDLLRANSAAAALAIRQMSDADLDRAVPASLYSDAPITTQFMLEDHAVRHSFHHLAGIKRALKR